jgi:hypothetical protein
MESLPNGVRDFPSLYPDRDYKSSMQDEDDSGEW